MSDRISSDYLLPNLFGGGSILPGEWALIIFLILAFITAAMLTYHYAYVETKFKDMENTMKTGRDELIRMIFPYSTTQSPTTTMRPTTTMQPNR